MKTFIRFVNVYSDACSGIAFAIFIVIVIIGMITWINTAIKTTAINDCINNTNNIKECRELFER